MNATEFTEQQKTDAAWIETYSGRRFYLLKPVIKDILITDIAHSLSLQCRWTGHCKFHYSIAQHSYYCSFIGVHHEALDRLLHDASEAYMGDMNRPLKHFTAAGPAYRAQENVVQSAIHERFGLAAVEPESVKIADTLMLYKEKQELMTSEPWDYDWGNMSKELGETSIEIDEWTPRFAERKFLERFYELYRRVH